MSDTSIIKEFIRQDILYILILATYVSMSSACIEIKLSQESERKENINMISLNPRDILEGHKFLQRKLMLYIS